MWDLYKERLTHDGFTKRERTLAKLKGRLKELLPNSLNYHKVLINGVEQYIAIIAQKELSEKSVCSLPDETLEHGGIVDWENNKWIITEIDANRQDYTRGTMLQCNYLLRWRNFDGKIIEKWSIVEDGTKYLIGEKAEESIAVGDARFAVTVPSDLDTFQLHRGNRFLIEADGAEVNTAYEITKINRMFNYFDGKGICRLILRECNLTPNDNLELRVADYYEPAANTDTDFHYDKIDYNDDKKVWI